MTKLNKAQLFSMMAVFMSFLFIFLFSGLTHVALNKNVEIVETEIARFGSLAESLDYFVHSSLDTSGYLFLNASLDKLYVECASSPTSACYFDDYMAAFTDCVATGEYAGWNCLPNGQSGFNISYRSQILDLANRLESRYSDLELNVSPTKVSISQSGPYTFELNGEVNIRLSRPDYSWNRFFNVTREISVIGMNDPALIAFGINKSIAVHPIEGDLMTVASLHGKDYRIAQLINESYYFRDNRSGLSIVEMFEGDQLTTPNNDIHNLGINCVLPLSLVEDGSGNLVDRPELSLLEHQFLADFHFLGGNTLLRFDPNDFLGVDDDIIMDAGLFARLGITDYLYVGSCCDNSGCEDTCG